MLFAWLDGEWLNIRRELRSESEGIGNADEADGIALDNDDVIVTEPTVPLPLFERGRDSTEGTTLFVCCKFVND